MMIRTHTLTMMVAMHQMTMIIMNLNPKIPIPKLVMLPHLESLGHCNLTLFERVNH
jgi:hypothetical protein